MLLEQHSLPFLWYGGGGHLLDAERRLRRWGTSSYKSVIDRRRNSIQVTLVTRAAMKFSVSISGKVHLRFHQGGKSLSYQRVHRLDRD
jgi:hypothetical protein